MLKEIIEILKFKLIDTKSIDFTIGNLLILLIALVGTSIILKLIRKIVTRKLPLEDKNKFVSVFQFIKYVVYVLVFMFTLDYSGVNMNVFLQHRQLYLLVLGLHCKDFFKI